MDSKRKNIPGTRYLTLPYLAWYTSFKMYEELEVPKIGSSRNLVFLKQEIDLIKNYRLHIFLFNKITPAEW